MSLLSASMAAAFSPSSLFALPNSAAISSGKPNKGGFFLGRRRSSISWPLIHRNRGNSCVSPVAVPTWPDVPTPDEAPRSANTDFFVTSDETLSVHAGERCEKFRIALNDITTPVVNTSAYLFKNRNALIASKESFDYNRFLNPASVSLEKKMSALEKAESTLFISSGFHTCGTVLLSLVPKGGHIITTTGCYERIRMFIEDELPERGISATVIDPADMDSLKIALEQNNVALFFTESPTYPLLRCINIKLVSKLCHSKGALVCVDSTFAPPVIQKPITLGADLVIHSTTKFIAGSINVIGGCVSGQQKLISRMRQYLNMYAGVIDQDKASEISKGMKTLHLRVPYQNNTALRMARLLEGHPKIERVYYPGLASHLDHEIAREQMTGFGGVVSFRVARSSARKFLYSLKIPYVSCQRTPVLYSFGDCESQVIHASKYRYYSQLDVDMYGIEDNLVTFSFGVEAFEDLRADILQALEAI